MTDNIISRKHIHKGSNNKRNRRNENVPSVHKIFGSSKAKVERSRNDFPLNVLYFPTAEAIKRKVAVDTSALARKWARS